MDTKFSVALHMLIYISESDKTASSENLAKSINTSSSHVRKVAALLKKAGLISSRQGVSGFFLEKQPKEITLAQVYAAVYPEKQLLTVHQNSNQECPVGSHIKEIVEPAFNRAQAAFMAELEVHSVADLITDLYRKVGN